MTEEEYQEQLELIRLTQHIIDNKPGAHQARWDNFLNRQKNIKDTKKPDPHQTRWNNFLNRQKNIEDAKEPEPTPGSQTEIISVKKHAGDSLYKIKETLGVSETKLK